MAEQLGTAVLRLEVDASPLRQGLADARRLVEGTSSAVERRTRQAGGGGGGRSRSGGARENTRALEIAQERRFRLARRIDALEERGADVARLRRRLGDLTEAQTRRQFGSFRQISQELARQVVLDERRQQAVERRRRTEQQAAAAGARAGGARESVFALEQAQDRRFRLSQRIERLEERGVNVSRLRTRLGELTEAQSKRQFGTFRQQSRELDRQLSLSEARYRREQATQRVQERTARIGGPRSPIGGAANIEGSPAFLRAQQRAAEQAIERSIRAGGPASPISGRLVDGSAVAGSPAALRDEQRRQLADARRIQQEERRNAQDRRRQISEERRAQRERDAEIRRLARAGGPASPVTGRLFNGTAIPGSPAFLRDQQRQVTAAQRIAGPSLPLSGRLGDGTAVAGSPAARRDALRVEQRVSAERARSAREEERQLRESRSRRGQAISSGVIGGAFPLLFGQGAGASVGGLAGGLLGGLAGGAGGFAGSLVGTAIGAQVDAAVQRLNTLGSALNDPIGKFQELAQAGLISSSALQKNVEALIASGREAEAAAQLQLDAAEQFGDTSSLTQLSSATDEMNRSFAQLSVVLTKFVAGPLADFFSKLAAANRLISGRQLFQERVGGLGLSDQQRQDVLSEARASTRDNPAELYTEALAIIDRIYGATQNQIALEQKLSQAVDRTNSLRSISFRLIDAEAFGNEALTLDLERRRIELERINQLQALGPRPAQAARERIDTEAAQAIYALEQRRARLQRQSNAERVSAASRLSAFEDQITASVQGAALSGNGRQALQAVIQLRDAVRAQQEAQAALAVTPGSQSLIFAAQVAAKAVEAAAAKTRADLLDAYDAARRSAQSISRSVEDLSLSALQNRTGGQGVTQFLSGQALYDTQQATFRALQPLFEQARATQAQRFAADGNFTAANQISSLNFAGSTAGVNQAMLDFISASRNDTRIQQDLYNAQIDLSKASRDLAVVTGLLTTSNETLAQAMPALTQAVGDLAGKDWTVQVNVAANGATQAYGDVVAGAISP